MLSPLHLVQIAVALLPVVGLVVLAADPLTSAKSITMGTIKKTLAMALVPGYVILGLHGLFASPVVSGFMASSPASSSRT